jgi:hypothetical protein
VPEVLLARPVQVRRPPRVPQPLHCMHTDSGGATGMPGMHRHTLQFRQEMQYIYVFI